MTEKLTTAQMADTIDEINCRLCVAELACEGLGSDCGTRPGDAKNVALLIYQCRQGLRELSDAICPVDPKDEIAHIKRNAERRIAEIEEAATNGATEQ
jgi:hypothetical protein